MIKKLFVKEIIFLPIFLLTLFVSVNKVNAEGLYSYPYFYNFITDDKYVYDNYQSEINQAITYLQNNYSGQFSDYIVYNDTNYANGVAFTFIFPTTSNVFYYQQVAYSSSVANAFNFDFIRNDGFVNCRFKYKEYNSYINSPELICGTSYPTNAVYVSLPLMTSSDFTFYATNPEITLDFPSYSDSDLNIPSYTIGDNNNLPTYQTLINDDYIVNPSVNFTTINLKQYDYVILSLKNYNITGEKITPIYTLGQLCLTRVNDYGMQEVSSTTAGYQTAPCTSYYSSSTPVNLYIQSQYSNPVSEEKPVWYVKSPVDERPNTISVDTSIFNISYITSSNSNNPTVNIGGRSYPVIPYQDLTDTAIKSTNEGYISGQVCLPGDVNCQSQNMGMDISDLFTQPLRLLQSVWGAITSVFTLITSFIGFLPPLLQTFLYTSFMLGLIIGIIKIIL